MGYDAHITRAEFWADNSGHEITAAEWQAVVDADPELEPWPEQGPYFARWRGESTLPDPWLDWHDGDVYTKSPDPALLAKCCALAARLGARVQGDDGEEYELGPDGQAREAGAASPPAAGGGDARPWWRRWLG
jgi:hypothetical protein